MAQGLPKAPFGYVDHISPKQTLAGAELVVGPVAQFLHRLLNGTIVPMNKQTLRAVIFIGLFAIPFIPFLVSGSFFFPFITTKAFTFRIIVEVIFGVWLILAFLDSSYRPKRSPILYAVGLFIFIIGLADLLGVEPIKSFWSNYERMEGFVSLLHFGGLFLVISSIFQDKEWKWWWNTSLVASLLMVFYAYFQLLGTLEIHQGGARVDGSIGNAAYLALYLLVHVFVAIYYFVKAKSSGLRWVYGGLIVLQTSVIYFSATRGAILGLVGGLFLIALLNLKNKENQKIQKLSKYALIGLVAFVAVFYMARGSDFVTSSPVLSRFSNLSISALKTEGRAFVWPMAIEGIKERPILGWGQENFNYVFAKHYQAEMFRIEPWFDRAHNIFLDWGIAGGLLGLVAYLSLYGVFILSLWKRESDFSYAEKSVLTGLLSAYFFNNFFVFDNLLSYILFFSLLAYLHTKTGLTSEKLSNLFEKLNSKIVMGVTVGIIFVAVYAVNIKPIIANTSLIKALQTAQVGGNQTNAITNFKKSYEASRLGRPEVIEWVSSSAPTVLADSTVSMEDRNAYYVFARDVVEKMTEELDGDPRYEIVAGNFYMSVGAPEDARRHLERARELMPEKQPTHFSLGQLALQENKLDEAMLHLKTAYELAPEYQEAKIIYLLGAIYTKDYSLMDELIESLDPRVLLDDNRIFSVMSQTGQKSLILTTLSNLKKKLPAEATQIDDYIRQVNESNL